MAESVNHLGGSRVSQLYNTSSFNEKESDRIKKSIVKLCLAFFKNVKNPLFYLKVTKKHVTVLDWLPQVNPRFIGADIIAGITVGIMCIPQGMADALLASLPPVNGLYVCFFPCLVYALFGTSPHLAYGPIAIVSLFSGIAIEKLTTNFEQSLNVTANSTEYIAEVAEFRLTAAVSLTVLVGIFQLILGFSGLGIVSRYFSDTFVSSYTCASAIHVIMSQIKDLFGIKNTVKYSGMFNVPKSFVDIVSKLPNSNYKTILVSVGCLIWLVTFKEYLNPLIKKKLKISFPSELFLVIIVTASSYLGDFDSKFEIKTIGDIPSGFPTLHMPDTKLWSQIISDALVIALIAFSISISLVSLFAKKHQKSIETRQELYAYGLSNILSSFFGCYPSSGSLSRSSVMEGAGAKTMLSGIFCSLILLIVILFVGPLFEKLPNACLAAIIVAAFKSILLQALELPRLWLINKYESLTWLVTFLAVVVLDVDYGLYIGVGVSILFVVVKDQNFQFRSLESYNNTTHYCDRDFVSYVNRNPAVNAKIFKAQRSIYYVNCESFKNELFKQYGFSPSVRLQEIKQNLKGAENVNFEEALQNNQKLKQDPDIILDFSGVDYMDTSGVNLIKQMVVDFKKIGVQIYICEAQDEVIKLMHRMKVLDKLDENIYVTVGDAINAITSNKVFNEVVN